MFPQPQPSIATDSTGPDMPAVRYATVAAAGTTFYVERRGVGLPLLLIHGGGEDSSMLAGQAAALADAGFEVITYDRRGTARSGRDQWPGDGAAQHADDAAAILSSLQTGPAVVVGVSSGGIVGLELAARHPGQVVHVVAWEPPAVGVLPGGADIATEIMAPIDAHLAAHPGDYVGAQALLLSEIVGFPVRFDDPAFAAARANAEPMIRDEPNITLAAFTADDFDSLETTIAVGSHPNDVVAAGTARLAELTGRDLVRVDGDHEIYLTDPDALTTVVVDAVGDPSQPA